MCHKNNFLYLLPLFFLIFCYIFFNLLYFIAGSERKALMKLDMKQMSEVDSP